MPNRCLPKVSKTRLRLRLAFSRLEVERFEGLRNQNAPFQVFGNVHIKRILMVDGKPTESTRTY